MDVPSYFSFGKRDPVHRHADVTVSSCSNIDTQFLAAKENVSVGQAGLAGIFTGLAMLSKYAAIYLPVGLLLWWISGRQSLGLFILHGAAYVTGIFISLAPNLIWNIKNGFVTARHLSHNANLDEPQYSILGSMEFSFSNGYCWACHFYFGPHGNDI